MHHVIIIRGPLGVGKTTIARKLAEQIHACYFSIDEALSQYKLDTGDSILVENFLRAQELLLPLIQEALTSQSVIVDGNFYYTEQVEYFQARFQEQLNVYTLDASLETCVERDANRPRSYGRDAVEYLHMMVHRFQAGENVLTDGKSEDEVVGEIVHRLMQK